MKVRHLLVVLVGAAAMVACSQQKAGGDTSQANNLSAEVSNETSDGMDNHLGPVANMGMQAQGPFAASERSMHEKMMAAVGVDPSDTWVRKMIEHHQGAVDMSREVLPLNPTPEVRRMAQMTIDKQSKEIDELRELIRQGKPSQVSAQLYKAADNEMMQRMMAASGANPSETWTRKMIEHHRGALAMSDIVLAQNPPAEIRRLAEQTKVDQGKEIAELERMLQGSGSRG